MEAEIRAAYPDATITLIDGGKGVFDVKCDDTLVFSKHAVGRHAEDGEILRALAEHLA